MRRSFAVALTILLAWVLAGCARAEPADPGAPLVWIDDDADGEPRIHVHLFWSQRCPHCLAAKAELERLATERPWLVTHMYEVTTDADAAATYVRLAESLGESARFVPGIALCGHMLHGDPGRERLAAEIDACRHETPVRVAPVTEVDVPLVGSVDVAGWSLLLTTVVLAGLDAFNPCAFFVLLVLLGMLVHAQSRVRMAMVAGVFIVVSGLWYFLFMAAWLNVFLWVGEMRWITALAGLVAIGLAVLDIKDFLGRPGGPSLSIPESAKPGLFRRMRTLLRAESLPSAMLGALVLAAVANTYELLCTAGFPLVYTRVLTLAAPAGASHYLWLALYNVVYVLPLAAIAALFVWTLGARKLQAHQGRALKLLAGTMMLTMGVVLVLAPDLLTHLGWSAALLGFAIGATVVATWLDRRLRTSRAG